MEGFVKGDVIVVRFPFSDLSGSQRRPALVLYEDEDVLLAQITSKARRNEYAVSLEQADFRHGSLNKPSNIRADKLFTCSKNLIKYKAAAITQTKINQVIQTIHELLNR
jgi:mRNA interferase MazF